MTQIYLISPQEIEKKSFLRDLEIALKTSLVPIFQLRLKNYDQSQVKIIADEARKICADNNCLFLLNDYPEVALEIGANGVHLGQDDGEIAKIRKNCDENFIIGASCYDSRDLACDAAESGANYVSFGTFFPSKTKNSKGKPNCEIIKWANEIIQLRTCAIGGINDENCAGLIAAKVDFLAVISYVWQHQKGVEYGLKKLRESCLSQS